MHYIIIIINSNYNIFIHIYSHTSEFQTYTEIDRAAHRLMQQAPPTATAAATNSSTSSSSNNNNNNNNNKQYSVINKKQ